MSDPLPIPSQETAPNHSALALGSLSQAALDEAENTLSPNTRRTYGQWLARIEDIIRANHGLPREASVPIDDKTVSEALLSMEREGLGISAMTNGIAALKFAALISGSDCPVGRSCNLVMKAIRRRAPARKQAAAVVWDKADLAAALAAKETRADGSVALAGQRDAAIIATMSDCLLRIGEASALLIGDIERFEDGSGTLLIRKDKTSNGELGGGRTLFIGASTVERIDAWLEAAGFDPLTDDGPLFRRLKRNGDATRCGLCDLGRRECCRHNVAPHPCCRHPNGHSKCVDGECCWHSSRPHRCCRHPMGAPDCNGNPCCSHLGGCEECRCRSALSPSTFREIIKMRAAAAGVSGAVTGHSMRVGSAVSLARANCELPAIMQAGRWTTSAMVARYTRREEASRGAVAKLRYAA